MNSSGKVNWTELFPYEFKARLKKKPVVYLPLGLCEPHGQISAFGLDLFKAEYICTETAKRVGGIVAPYMGWHVHESGPSARWLEENVGETNPHMTSVPPFAYYHFFLYQLRSFYNAGFHEAIVLSGHGGAHAADLKCIAERFERRFGMKVWYGTDFDLAAGAFAGDHAGRYEISTLMYLRPELVDFTLKRLENEPESGGRFALGDTAADATMEYGRDIIEACVQALSLIVSRCFDTEQASGTERKRLAYEEVEALWQELVSEADRMAALRPREGKTPVGTDSMWKPYERSRLRYDVE